MLDALYNGCMSGFNDELIETTLDFLPDNASPGCASTHEICNEVQDGNQSRIFHDGVWADIHINYISEGKNAETYQIIEQIMGEVESRAVKVAHDEYRYMPELNTVTSINDLHEWKNESLIWRIDSLNHPAFPELIRLDNRTFDMEYINGKTLSETLQNHKPMTMNEALIIMQRLAEGVMALHHSGVIHGDLHHKNILLKKLPDGSFQPKIIDFGNIREKDPISNVDSLCEVLDLINRCYQIYTWDGSNSLGGNWANAYADDKEFLHTFTGINKENTADSVLEIIKSVKLE